MTEKKGRVERKIMMEKMREMRRTVRRKNLLKLKM